MGTITSKIAAAETYDRGARANRSAMKAAIHSRKGEDPQQARSIDSSRSQEA
jgi:hypothetical protein